MIWRKKFSKETKNRDRKIIKLSHCETGTKNFREIALQNSSCLVLKFRQSNASLLKLHIVCILFVNFSKTLPPILMKFFMQVRHVPRKDLVPLAYLGTLQFGCFCLGRHAALTVVKCPFVRICPDFCPFKKMSLCPNMSGFLSLIKCP